MVKDNVRYFTIIPEKFCKIKQENCFIILQIVEETRFTVTETCRYAARCKTSDQFRKLPLLDDRLNNDLLTIYGNRDNFTK